MPGPTRAYLSGSVLDRPGHQVQRRAGDPADRVAPLGRLGLSRLLRQAVGVRLAHPVLHPRPRQVASEALVHRGLLVGRPKTWGEPIDRGRKGPWRRSPYRCALRQPRDVTAITFGE